MGKISNKLKIILCSISLLILIIILIIILLYKSFTSPVDKNNKEVYQYEVKSGENYSLIASNLKKEKFIKNELVFKIFVKLMEPKSLEAGIYELSPSMDLKTIIDTFNKGAKDMRETVSITFVEGKNMRYVISKITENMDITEEEILNKLKDEEYLNSLIDKYFIITDEIKNKDIYYSLEGYLYPDTYTFYKDSTIEEIFEKMINNLESKLTSYKSEIESSGYTFHQMLTLASIIEAEAGKSKDRKDVASVFYNRLKDNWALGSDVTTYYAEKLELWSRDLYKKEVNSCNAYNTRSSCMRGKLPVGPICNPSIDSVIASIEPNETKYYFFVADMYGNTYFNETASGHDKTINKLKREGKWYEYN